MDMTTVLGILIGLLGLIGGFMMDGGQVSSLFVYSAMLIVFGGTIGAVVISFPKSKLKGVGNALRMAFQERKLDMHALIDDLIEMAIIARRSGVLTLEDRIQECKDPFMREGLILVIDGTDPTLTRDILELNMEAIEHKHESWAHIFEAAGGYAPTMGIIGTVMGLIHVLSNLSDPHNLGPAIAVAFTATLYGVMSANLIYLPIANKIKMRSKEVIAEMEIMMEGILSLQAGENPYLIKKKLESFFLEEQKPQTARKAGEDYAEEA